MALAELCAIIESAVGSRGAALMGVVNTTPDSFFDGGRYASEDAARARVDALVALNTTILDIGGESTRPGSEPVPAAEQIARIDPALTRAVEHGALVSVDTTSAEVAEFALARGASIVNDVSCLADPAIAEVAARHDAGLVLMHSRGPMSRMPGFSQWPEDGYGDVVREVREELGRARDAALERGVRKDRLFVDPGLGFAKSARQSFELLRRLPELLSLGSELVVGPSRKSFIASVDPVPPGERLGGTIAACLVAVERGAKILRVHDVRDVQQALAVHRSVRSRPEEAAHAR
ncbi:MAG TPA: dihydropteroate synthase [Polyangiaceae bacterium]|nr:dihydropteroate synthase [Polyangiaceae bacterium]